MSIHIPSAKRAKRSVLDIGDSFEAAGAFVTRSSGFELYNGDFFNGAEKEEMDTDADANDSNSDRSEPPTDEEEAKKIL